MCDQRYADGLKFILSCSKTHRIFRTMSYKQQLSFLSNLLVENTEKYDIEIREIFKLKLTQAPFATLSIFIMIQDNKNQKQA